nr:Polyprenol-phosphate-mannose-dependent alpha-(1-2)-phosphatidylinositol mannoside mannosyltransferase [Streptococcus thermophilus]
MPVAFVLLGAIIGAINLGHSFFLAVNETLLDVGVFRDAGNALVNGDPLYDGFPTRSGFAFIYPPFAALLFVPLTWLPEVAMDIAWNTSIILAIFAIIGMACHRLGLERWWMWAIGLTGFSTLLDTVYTNLYYGQINVFLILLVAADVLGYTPKKIRGIGVGVAAGIKLTPAAYGVIFLVRKDWWSVARSAGFFALTALIGLALRPKESIYFWTEEFFVTDRGGDVFYPPNQGVGGMLSRGLLSAETVESIAPFILLTFALLSIFIAYRLEQRGRSVEALLVVVLGISLGAPIAVSHHWVGVILILPLIFAAQEKNVRVLLAIAAGAMISPSYTILDENNPQVWAWPLWLNTNIFGLMGLAIFVAYLVIALQKPPHENRRGDSKGTADPGAGHGAARPAAAEVDAEDTRAGELDRQSHAQKDNC